MFFNKFIVTKTMMQPKKNINEQFNTWHFMWNITNNYSKKNSGTK